MIENEKVDIEKAILVALNDDRGPIEIEYSINELRELAMAAGAEVKATEIQNKSNIDPAYYIGKGKVEEIKELCSFYEATMVIFNDELSGSQTRNLESVLGVKVIDRTALILDIFAKRASSAVSRLQVELALLRYTLPRLSGFGKTMSRTGAGIGTRGLGEQKLELDRRRIRERISDIRHELKEAVKNRHTQRARRSKNEVPVVAIVGYTNAGKSTLMNRLLTMSGSDDEKHVFEKDMLFATLDTYSRKINFSDMKEFVLVDTVGFVSKLPHSLVEAFKATLEEVVEADLLLHVVDSTNSNFYNQISITDEVLKEIGASGKKTIYCLNKCDLLDDSKKHDLNLENAILVSSKLGTGFEELIERISSELFSSHRKIEVLIPYNKGSLLSEIMDTASVSQTSYEEEGTLVECTVDERLYGKLKEYII